MATLTRKYIALLSVLITLADSLVGSAMEQPNKESPNFQQNIGNLNPNNTIPSATPIYVDSPVNTTSKSTNLSEVPTIQEMVNSSVLIDKNLTLAATTTTVNLEPQNETLQLNNSFPRPVEAPIPAEKVSDNVTLLEQKNYTINATTISPNFNQTTENRKGSDYSTSHPPLHNDETQAKYFNNNSSSTMEDSTITTTTQRSNSSTNASETARLMLSESSSLSNSSKTTDDEPGPVTVVLGNLETGELVMVQ